MTDRIVVRMSTVDKRRFEKKAESYGMKLSGFIRWLLISAPKKETK